MILTMRQIHGGEHIPRGWGVAWMCTDGFAAYVLPIPLNKVAGAFRNLWLYLQAACDGDLLTAEFKRGYDRAQVKQTVEIARLQGELDQVRNDLKLFADITRDMLKWYQEAMRNKD